MLWLALWKVWSLGYGEIDYNSLAGRGDTLLAFYTAGAETLKVARLEGDEWVQEVIAVDKRGAIVRGVAQGNGVAPRFKAIVY